MVTLEDAVHKGAVDRAPVFGEELWQFFATLLKCVAAFSGPYIGVKCDFGHALRVALGEQGRLQCPRGYAVDQQRGRLRLCQDVGATGGKVVGAVADVEIDVAVFVGAAITFVVHGPGVETTVAEPLHG